MEFGKISQLGHVDWTLPADDAKSISFLQQLPKEGPTKYYIGAPAWGSKTWIGRLYPEGTKSTEFLHYYAQNFNTIELNTTHYRIPNSEQIQKWREQVPNDFVFCPKVFQGISHSPNGLLDKATLKEWLHFLESLGENCGPCFLQLPPHFEYSQKAQLFHFLQNWPDDFELALEFRHPTWFQNQQLVPALVSYLQSRKIALVITDVAGRRDVLHSAISAPFAMLRFIGNSLDPSDFERLQDWAKRLRSWSEQGLQRVFFFVHQPDDIKTPEMATAVVETLNEKAGAGLTPLHWVEKKYEQESLF